MQLSSARLVGKWAPVVALVALSVGSASAASTGRPFETRDSIQISDFTQEPIISPDGRYFVTVTERGVLPEGVTESTVWLFETAAVGGAISSGLIPQPVPLARISAVVNMGPAVWSLVTKISWSPDSASVHFLGRNGQENRQLFRVNLGDRKISALSASTQDVADFSFVGRRVVYLAAPDLSNTDSRARSGSAGPDVVVGTGNDLAELLWPGGRLTSRNLPTPFEIWSSDGAVATPVRAASTGGPLRLIGSHHVNVLVGSPDGTRVVVVAHADEVPESWGQYATSGGPDTRAFLPHAASEAPEMDFGRALQYQVIDLEKGERRPLLVAPLADWQRGGTDALDAVWSADGRYVAVSGTYLPLDIRPGSSSRNSCGAAVVDTRSRAIQCVLDGSISSASAIQRMSWNADGNLIVRLNDANSQVYRQRGGGWQRISRSAPAPASATGVELSIRQSLNDPPALFARDPTNGREREIFDPNPQLADIAMATVTQIFWKDSHGRTINGGLVKPPDFVPGRRYPLVIQTHNFRPRRFFRTGTASTASAGRALAARGMLVLQVDEPDDAFMFTAREATENGTKVYLAAVDQLVAEGLVDPQRVGIAGYSRTAFYVSKAITDEPDRFAAAVVANGEPGSLVGYYAGIAGAIDEDKWTGLLAGAQPYGDGLTQWIRNAPGFRTDRIRAPVLISIGGPGELLGLWGGLYAPLRQQGKPVELQYIRSGQHNFNKPAHILAHQQFIVDWFDFWLNGHESPDAAKRDQYRRWQAFREAVSKGSAVETPP